MFEGLGFDSLVMSFFYIQPTCLGLFLRKGLLGAVWFGKSVVMWWWWYIIVSESDFGRFSDLRWNTMEWICTDRKKDWKGSGWFDGNGWLVRFFGGGGWLVRWRRQGLYVGI